MSAEFIEAIIDEVNSLIVLGREYGEDVSQLEERRLELLAELAAVQS